MKEEDYWLECQQCGYPIRQLTYEEWLKVVRDPYSYILFCFDCRKIENALLSQW